MKGIDTDLHGLYALMRANAEAHPFNPTPLNLVDEACCQKVNINGKLYTFILSLNLVHIPKFKGLSLLVPGFYTVRKFWHLTVTGDACWPSDELMKEVCKIFFPCATPFLETTDETLKCCRPFLSHAEYLKMRRTQRQFTQIIPDKLVV